MRQRRIGIYPGTFDPIHAGHLAFAREAMQVCNLDEVIFLPEEIPRGKQNVTDITHRMALINYAIEDVPQLKAIRAVSKQFDVAQTLPELLDIYKDNTLTLLVGSDVAKSLPNWEGIETLVGAVSFAIGMRSGDNINEIESKVNKVTTKYTFIDTPEAQINSTAIRAGIDSDLHVSHPSFLAYIQQHHLYETSRDTV